MKVNRFDEQHYVASGKVSNDLIQGYVVLDVTSLGCRWLQDDGSWGPFRSANLFLFLRRAEEACRKAILDGLDAHVLIKLSPPRNMK